MIYKTLAKDKETKQYKVIEKDYRTKTEFLRDVRRNGYTVNASRTKTKLGYDWVVDNTDGRPQDWEKVK